MVLIKQNNGKTKLARTKTTNVITIIRVSLFIRNLVISD